MTIKTFRGMLADGGQDRIYLAGGDGSTGFRIVKFELMTENPGSTEYKHVVKIYKTLQTTATADMNFDDDNLLAGAYTEGSSSLYYNGQAVEVIFDKEIVNQDIHITHVEVNGALSVNYYLELEEVRMSDAEAANVNFVAALTHT